MNNSPVIGVNFETKTRYKMERRVVLCAGVPEFCRSSGGFLPAGAGVTADLDPPVDLDPL
jgi:hypothetical protein